MSSRRVLAAHGLAPKKSFGQNFLDDPRLCARIADLAGSSAGTIVEIGAGLGALTVPLLERADRVVAIERDRDLVPLLRERFSGEPKLTVLEADAAKADYRALLTDAPTPRVLAGNLPYQITGRLVSRAVEVADLLERAVFMVQLEVAERLTASPGGRDYGLSTVFSQAAFVVKRAFKVPAGAFHPPPKVDSAVIVLTPHAERLAEEDEIFREVVKSAFAQRRKTLRNGWKGLAGLDRDSIAAAAAEAGISLDARAQTLAVAQFAAMAEALRQRR